MIGELGAGAAKTISSYVQELEERNGRLTALHTSTTVQFAL
jgi:hypothetical protein